MGCSNLPKPRPARRNPNSEATRVPETIALPPNNADRVLTPEIVDPRLADVEALARWLDYAFALPGGFRFGVAGIIGLIPGIGDVIDGVISLYIVFRAVQLGIPRIAITRMVVNVGIGTLVGSVPLIGDLFDVAFKANLRNYRILKKHAYHAGGKTRGDWLFVLGAGLVLVAMLSLPVIAVIEVLRYLAR